MLNFNYKFREIASKKEHKKEYDTIKIQTQKLNNMQNFTEILKEVSGTDIQAKEINIDTDKLITYSYTCLDQTSWNESTDIKMLEKEFEKYMNIKTAGEQTDDVDLKKQLVYTEKNCYYGFTSNTTMILTNDSNVKNYTKLPFEYENERLYHYIYTLYQKIYLKKLNYELQKTKNFENIKNRFITFTKENCPNEITNNPTGELIEDYYQKGQKLTKTFMQLKNKYDLLYKEYQIKRINKIHKYTIAVVGTIIIIVLAKVWAMLL